ncbi:MAG: trigger factor [Candidatus Pelagibacter sp. TMED165]|nr:MAG: trigger factor [Candidatus Pelagibacter sp. TMED165]
MKVEIKSKKGLRTCLSIIVDKTTIQNKLNERLLELQSEVSLKGFRPGKVPAGVIKSQFGKAVYGEVIDKLLKETSSNAIKEKKIKAAGQPKLDLKTFGEGKDLNFTLEIDCLPEIKLKPFETFKVNDYKVKIDSKIIEDKLQEISKQNKKFEDKKETDKAVLGDQVVFDYSATVDGNKFEGSEGKGVQLELGKDLFLKGFDTQLVGVKKKETKSVIAILPANHPKKELANKKTKFECQILNIKKSVENKIDNDFAKLMGAKDLTELRKLIENQISSQYNQALNSITKKEILDLIDKSYDIDLPQNLVENELLGITNTLKKEEAEKHKLKNEKLAKSRIKVGLILNEYGEKNNLKVEANEVQAEIQKQMKSMPGQEKMVIDYYQKNPNASHSLKGAIYEDKIISLIKSKIKLNSKILTTKEAEKVISDFNKSAVKNDKSKEIKSTKSKSKTKK